MIENNKINFAQFLNDLTEEQRKSAIFRWNSWVLGIRLIGFEDFAPEIIIEPILDDFIMDRQKYGIYPSIEVVLDWECQEHVSPSHRSDQSYKNLQDQFGKLI